tara:strand:+ start:6306 stop:6881 length:576 start_codon:yes stop_codon:yes gene_type:complete
MKKGVILWLFAATLSHNSLLCAQQIDPDLLPPVNEEVPLVLEALAKEAPLVNGTVSEDGGFGMWVDIMAVRGKTKGDGLMGFVTVPTEIGKSVGTQVASDPGESLLGVLLMGLTVDQIGNGGDVTQGLIDTVRGSSGDSSSTPPVDRFGDRDFATATADSCTAAAMHSKDITLDRSSSGTCNIEISTTSDE